MKTTAAPLTIGGTPVAPGTRARIEIPIGRRVSGAEVRLPVEVVHGAQPGPRLFVCAALHGDEINGVEIIRRVLRRRLVRRMRGALIAVPVVNLFGFVGLSRYLPDRRDLNRSFPGSATGSLASRIAHIFLKEVVDNASHGIDLHTGAAHRANLPQVRACLDDPETLALAREFGVPVLLNANVRDGSLRQAVLERNVPMLVYEGGEALRFDEQAIRAGVRGVFAVMHHLGMVAFGSPGRHQEPFVANSSHWVRAPEAGILRARASLGVPVAAGDVLGVIADPLGTEEAEVRAGHAGVVIARTELPLVNEGDAIFHLATFQRPDRVAESVDDFQEALEQLES